MLFAGPPIVKTADPRVLPVNDETTVFAGIAS